MGSKVSQRVVYLVTAAIVASMVAGFSIAQFQLGQTNTSYQGSQTTTVTSLPGLTWSYTELSEVNASTVITTGCGASATTACDVTNAGMTVCAGNYDGDACSPGDFIEQVNLTTVASTSFNGSTHFPVNVTLTVLVTGTPLHGTPGTYAGIPFYFKETGTNRAVNIALDFDIGVIPNGPGSVTSVSVLATT